MSAKRKDSTNVGTILSYWFMPYWPIFIFFCLILGTLGSIYLYISVPSYEASAVLMIKDEKKGYDDSRMVALLNIYSAKKIVENEIEVIRSRSLVKEVVNNLNLYAPIYSKKNFITRSAYLESPIIIEVKEPEQITEHNKIFFEYDHISGKVKINGKLYPKDRWIGTKYGVLRFSRNPKLVDQTSDPLFFNLVPIKVATNGLINLLNINAVNKLSSVVTIKIKDEVPQRAEDIINELIQEYTKAGLNDKNSLASNTLNFVDERLNHVAVELDSIEGQVEVYRSKKGAVNLSEQSVNFLNNLGDNDQKISVMQMNLAVLDAVEKSVTNGKGKKSIAPSTLGVDDPLLTQLLNRLYAAETEYNKLKNTTAENNPLLASLANEIEQTRPKIIENIKLERIRIKTSLKTLESTNSKYATRLSSIPEKERELLEISRHQATINNVYNFLLQKREETALSQASTMSDLRVIDLAEADIKQSKIKKIVVPVAVLLLAFIFTVCIIIYIDLLSSKVLFRNTIENSSTHPIIAEIPKINKLDYPILDFSKSNFALEQFRQLAIALNLENHNNDKNIILVTSSIEGEGKSFVSSNLAQCLSLIGKKVLIIDVDLRKSTLTSNYQLSDKVGIVEYLENNLPISDIIYKENSNDISVIPTGKTKNNSSNLLTNQNLSKLFEYTKNNFDFVIVNSSPINPVADTSIVAPFCDTTLFVIQHNYTPAEILNSIDEKTDTRKLPDVNIIFNKIRSRGVFKNNFGYLHNGYGNENIYKI